MSKRDHRPVSHHVKAPPPLRELPCDVDCERCGGECRWVMGHHDDGSPRDYAACTRCSWVESPPPLGSEEGIEVHW